MYNAELTVCSDRDDLRTLILEPWAEAFDLRRGDEFAFTAQSPNSCPQLRVEVRAANLVVHVDWGQTSVIVKRNGHQIDSISRVQPTL